MNPGSTRRLLTVPLLVLTCVVGGMFSARAQDGCARKISFRFVTPPGDSPRELTLDRVSVIFGSACAAPLAQDQEFTMSAGAFVITGKLPAPKPFFGGVLCDITQAELDRSTFDPKDLVPFPDTGRLQIAGEDFEVSVEGDYSQLRQEHSAHTLSVGPASDASSETTTEPANALRLVYGYDFVTPVGSRKRSSLAAKLAIDTTDRKGSEFVDDNSISLTYRGGDHAAGSLIRRFQLTGDFAYARAVHSRAQTMDASVGAEFRVPLVQSVSLFRRGTGRFLAPPLSLALSYGYRSWDTPDAPEREDGGVFKGSATYHAYLFGRYRVDLDYHYTHTDLRDAPDLPATQRLYRATLSYLVDGRFSVRTSYEDGSIGPVLTKFKQYFIGVAFSDGI